MSTDDTLITSRDGRIARILLNRPRALNALNLDMIRAMTKALTEWRDDPHVHAVVITGAGDRAFCAGGDVINLREGQLSGDRTEVEAFFGEEYDLNYMIATYPKPYIALIDGICMGGGIGVSVYGPYRVATEHASFGMPETAIGFFPDIGGTYFMPRMPGELGMYLGLTGLRISGADSVHAGFATHYTPREDLPALSAALAKEGPAALARFNRTLPAYSLEPHLADIDAIFGTDSVVEMVQQLEKRDADWAKAALKAMRTVSPSALCWTVEALRRGADMTLRQALDAEFLLTRTTMAHPDFVEGVRAMVVDKDRKPQWKPARIEDVDIASIKAMFV
ncbi:MAG: enoyl-CoA hydratase/isomerase family protein [Acetobacteraceae bacterium]